MDKVWIVETYVDIGDYWEIDSVYSTEPGAKSREQHLLSVGWRPSEVVYDWKELKH